MRRYHGMMTKNVPPLLFETDLFVPKDDSYVFVLNSLDHGLIQLDARSMFSGNMKAAGLGRYILPNQGKSNVVFCKKPDRQATWGFALGVV
jgi:hypothetical protein